MAVEIIFMVKEKTAMLLAIIYTRRLIFKQVTVTPINRVLMGILYNEQVNMITVSIKIISSVIKTISATIKIISRRIRFFYVANILNEMITVQILR